MIGGERCWVPALLSVLLVAGGCESDSSSTPTPTSGATQSPTVTPKPAGWTITEADRAAIRQVVKRRAVAVRRNNLAWFLTTIDRTNKGLVASQRDLFANLQSLPLRHFGYSVDASTGYQPHEPEHVRSDHAFKPLVIEQVQIRGVDRAPTGNELDETFIERDGRWMLGWDGGQEHDFEIDRPWGGGKRLAVTTLQGLIVVVDRADAARGPELAQQLVDHVDDVAGVLGIPRKYGVLFDATTAGEDYRESARGREQSVAVTFSVHALTATGEQSSEVGMRIKADPHVIFEDSLDDNEHLLRHEVAHFLTLPQLSGSPDWLIEGIAEEASYGPDFPLEAAVISGHAYDELHSMRRALPITSKWGNNAGVDYLIAYAAVHALVSDYGLARVLALGRTYRSIRGVDPDVKTPKAMQRHFGLTEPALVARTWELLYELGTESLQA